jgi:hypothetical protein
MAMVQSLLGRSLSGPGSRPRTRGPHRRARPRGRAARSTGRPAGASGGEAHRDEGPWGGRGGSTGALKRGVPPSSRPGAAPIAAGVAGRSQFGRPHDRCASAARRPGIVSRPRRAWPALREQVVDLAGVVVGVLAEACLVEGGGLGGHDGGGRRSRRRNRGQGGLARISPRPTPTRHRLVERPAHRRLGPLLEDPAEPTEPGLRARRAVDRPEVAVRLAGEGEADQGMQQDRQVGDRPGDRPGVVEPGGEG